jgi:O-antigen ligase
MAGVGLAFLTVLAQAADRHDFALALPGLLLVVLACLAPTAGLAACAAMVSLKPPTLFDPLGYIHVLVIATLAGCAMRVLVARPTVRINFLTWTIVGVAIACAFAYVRVGGVVSLPREKAATSVLAEIESGIALILAAMYLGRRMRRDTVYAAILAAGALTAIMGIVTFRSDLLHHLGTAGMYMSRHFTGRAFGPFSNADYFGEAQAVILLFVVAWPGRVSRAWTAARIVVGVLVGTGVLISLSRGAILMVVVGLLILAWCRSRRTGALAVLTLGALLVLATPFFVAWRLGASPVGAASAASSFHEASLWRLQMVVAGLRMFLTSPIWGVGLGQFHYLSPRYLPSDVAITYSCSTFVTVLAEQGMLGIVALLAMLASMGWTLLRSAAQEARLALVMLAAFTCASLLAEPMTFVQASGILWILLGLGLVTASGERIAAALDGDRSVDHDPASGLSADGGQSSRSDQAPSAKRRSRPSNTSLKGQS